MSSVSVIGSNKPTLYEIDVSQPAMNGWRKCDVTSYQFCNETCMGANEHSSQNQMVPQPELLRVPYKSLWGWSAIVCLHDIQPALWSCTLYVPVTINLYPYVFATLNWKTQTLWNCAWYAILRKHLIRAVPSIKITKPEIFIFLQIDSKLITVS
jgi:hypothetical protein